MVAINRICTPLDGMIPRIILDVVYDRVRNVSNLNEVLKMNVSPESIIGEIFKSKESGFASAILKIQDELLKERTG